MNHARILIAGCGDLGITLGQHLIAQGCDVAGLRRSTVPLPAGIHSVQADVARPATLHGLAALRPNILVYSVAADAQTDDSYRAHYVDGLRNVLAALADAGLRHVFFVSSTRVYGRENQSQENQGQDTGPWLDETAPATPADFGGKRLLQAEALLAGLPGTTLRLSGIYGPGRHRLLALARRPQSWPAQNHWTNRIHRDDAAAFIASLIRRKLNGEPVEDCYLVTDGCPAPQYEVLQWLAKRLDVDVSGVAPPAVEGGKRLGNARMLATGYRLRYPDYRAGYAAEIARI